MTVTAPPRLVTPLAEWLATLPSRDGFYEVSANRAYAHDEAAYDAQYAVEPGATRAGQSLLSAIRFFGGRLDAPLLEIGCGTGRLSEGLATGGVSPELVFTDPSPSFLRLAAAKLAAHVARIAAPVHYAVLAGEDLERIPPEMFGVIALRSTLHHVLDVEKFFADARRALIPGGVLAVEEPCAEGYLLMGALAKALPALARAHKSPLDDAQRKAINRFAGCMRDYHRRDIDKSEKEDKHLFRTDELMKLAERCGMTADILVNKGSEQAAIDYGAREPRFDFYAFFRRYLKHCMAYDETLLAQLDGFARPYFDYVTTASAGGALPRTTAVCFFKKGGGPPAQSWLPLAPDIEYPDDPHSGEGAYRPSWSGPTAYVNAEHEGIFEATKEIPGWALHGDAAKQYELAYYSGAVILEIGTYGGRSAVCEILGALAGPGRHGDVRFYGIDVNMQSIERTVGTLDAWRLLPYAKLFCGTLEEFVSRHPIRPTMVFVDGDHRYEGVKRDCEVLERMLLPGTPVLFHDYANPENDSGEIGVRQAVREWVSSGRARFAGLFGCSSLVVTT